MPRKTFRYLVSGRVQGVAFRYWTRETASRLGLDGWTRNLPDGRVEVLAQGDEETLERLHKALRQGSPLSSVAGVERFEEPGSEGLDGFSIRR